MGGLGLHESQRSSHPAFLGSCNSAWILVSHLIPSFDVFPHENYAISYFQTLSIVPSNLSSQNYLQASLDDDRLLAIPPQSMTNLVYVPLLTLLGWLKAIPQPSLGLAFSPHELAIPFMVGHFSFPFVVDHIASMFFYLFIHYVQNSNRSVYVHA